MLVERRRAAPARAQLALPPASAFAGPGAPCPPALSALPRSRPAASPAWLLWKPLAPATRRCVSGAYGLGPRAPGLGEEASVPRQPRQAQRGARGGWAALRSVCCGGWPPPRPTGPGYVCCSILIARSRCSGSELLRYLVWGWARPLSRCRKPDLTWGPHILSFREIITLYLKITVFRIGHSGWIRERL